MPEHKFRLGQSVRFVASTLSGVPEGACQVTQRMPERDGEFQCRIKSPVEDHERVAKESELRALDAA
jgi:hypothetical protein